MESEEGTVAIATAIIEDFFLACLNEKAEEETALKRSFRDAFELVNSERGQALLSKIDNKLRENGFRFKHVQQMCLFTLIKTQAMSVEDVAKHLSFHVVHLTQQRKAS